MALLLEARQPGLFSAIFCWEAPVHDPSIKCGQLLQLLLPCAATKSVDELGVRSAGGMTVLPTAT